MSHIPAGVADSKPIELIHPDNLPAAAKDPDHVAIALETLVKHLLQLPLSIATNGHFR
ncbi:hypothetical protein K466DRAFT_668038 [Polyporus arcularius HHB13444]|uniref:Uncharacterized protein n=1 Tax=Polyporus arcularius HHB13444 TaxID=1314778 RepID=A0A5C3NQJ3_9APHY|nr:hypothetical protein K466DRAFT_668038 [Polyporus arcularius HHB13444]